MAALQNLPPHDQVSRPQKIFKPVNFTEPRSYAFGPLHSVITTQPRNIILDHDVFSPVNQNGSFEFDRVIKSGIVQKRTRKTKVWKPIFLVLRPNSLSIYKNQREDKLRHKIYLSDLTAIDFLKDPKNKRQHIFGLFSPSRNYHLEAQSSKDAKEWVDLIRKESRIEEEEEELFLSSSIANFSGSASLEKGIRRQAEPKKQHDETLGSSSPELSDPVAQIRKKECVEKMGPRKPSYTLEYSGNEITSHSDWSDTELSKLKAKPNRSLNDEDQPAVRPPPSSTVCGTRNLSQMSIFHAEQDLERVVWQGYLLWLRSKGGVRKWKNMWIVVRCKSITRYKDDSEYLPSLIIPLSSVINAVEIDPMSKTKKLCLQIITEEKSYRLCAHDEDTLNKSLGAIKSLIAKRRENRGLQ